MIVIINFQHASWEKLSWFLNFPFRWNVLIIDVGINNSYGKISLDSTFEHQILQSNDLNNPKKCDSSIWYKLTNSTRSLANIAHNLRNQNQIHRWGIYPMNLKLDVTINQTKTEGRYTSHLQQSFKETKKQHYFDLQHRIGWLSRMLLESERFAKWLTKYQSESAGAGIGSRRRRHLIWMLGWWSTNQ